MEHTDGTTTTEGTPARSRSGGARPSDHSGDRDPGPVERTGRGVGGLGGTLIGAGIGFAAGPIGSVVGGVAGALGGWWAGEKVGRAAEDFAHSTDDYHDHWEENAAGGLTFDDALVGYGVGHIAGHHPDLSGRAFEAIEPPIRRSWKHRRYDYDSLRPYVREGFRHGSERHHA